jgi:uncharacterized membrane protein YfcA
MAPFPPCSMEPKLSVNLRKRPHRQSRRGLSDGSAGAASVWLLAIGAAAGVFSALFGVGGGIIIVPLLVFVIGLAPRAAAGTSLAALVFTAAAGATAYALHGDVRLGAAAILGVPSVFGVVVGVALQQRLANRTLALGFALLLAGVGIRLLV